MIPFVDLKAQYHSIKPEIDAAIASVLESSQFILGGEVAAFEEEFAAYSGAAYGIGVNSGTSALHLALLAAGVGPGDEVITVSFTFVATVAAILYAGARPVLVDIDPRSFTMDPARVEAAITPRTKAIIPVHLYGQPADMGPILDIARRRGLVVIEDAAQAHGAGYSAAEYLAAGAGPRRCGSLGDLACFSFYPGKNLGAYGEGGMILTSNPEYARALRLLRNWGAEHKYEHVVKGYNNRLEGMQGAILRVKLRHLHAWTEARRGHARQYDALLAGGPVTPPVEMPYAGHVYHVYAVRTPGGPAARAALRQKLRDAGIETNIHYPIPVHLLAAHRDLGYQRGDFPCTEQAADQVLSLPMYPELTAAQIREVASAVIEYAA